VIAPGTPGGSTRKWALARFFFMSFTKVMMTEEIVTPLQVEIETRLAQTEPEVEVLLAEVVSAATLRLFIDHPDGVTLALCERVSSRLSEYRER
jgi:ribosome maturation factor RimP